MKQIITQLFKQAMHHVFGEDADAVDPLISRAGRAEYGDYQANFAMRLAKSLQQTPREIAQKVVDSISHPLFAKCEVSGPGFINITLSDAELANMLKPLMQDPRLNVEPNSEREIVVVDYANANVAKEMHVGHLRSIVLGDAIVRILSFLGNEVIRQSHLGDWGTQFGMLIEFLLEQGLDPTVHPLSDLDTYYKQSKVRFDQDEAFAERARKRVVLLQQGDEKTRAIWQALVTTSLDYFQTIYNTLDVLVTKEDARGESFYNDMLDGVVQELLDRDIATEDQGAIVVFLEEFLDAQKKPMPNIIRKRDGGYLYATTDLATVRYRVDTLHANRIIYLTDARQRQHFAMLFATVRRAGWVSDKVRLEHIPFGSILGADNKPFKTRSGESIKLSDLLNEAVQRALTLLREKNSQVPSSEQEKIARAIGIGALKYADLRSDKVRDYIFDWDKLLSFEGNTAPYLQNACVRIHALFRRANIALDDASLASVSIILSDTTEHQLALNLLQFADILTMVADTLALHLFSEYLFELAQSYHRFYEACPILSQQDEAIVKSRLQLSAITLRTLTLGLSLLGIETITKM